MITPWNEPVAKAWGFPWAGLCTGGLIALPNSTTHAHPQPTTGDCWRVQVPGQPAVTRSTAEAAADTAAGHTWRNYALLSGRESYLHGKSLNSGAWIYIDGNKTRWVIANVSLVGASDGSITASITLKQFGHFPGVTTPPTATYTYTLSDAQLGIYATVPANWQIDPLFRAVSSTGAKTTWNAYDITRNAYDVNFPISLYELTISGNGDTAPATFGAGISISLAVLKGVGVARTTTNTGGPPVYTYENYIFSISGSPNPVHPTDATASSSVTGGGTASAVSGPVQSYGTTATNSTFTIYLAGLYDDSDNLVYAIWSQSIDRLSTQVGTVSQSGSITATFTGDGGGIFTSTDAAGSIDTTVTHTQTNQTTETYTLTIGGATVATKVFLGNSVSIENIVFHVAAHSVPFSVNIGTSGSSPISNFGAGGAQSLTSQTLMRSGSLNEDGSGLNSASGLSGTPPLSAFDQMGGGGSAGFNGGTGGNKLMLTRPIWYSKNLAGLFRQRSTFDTGTGLIFDHQCQWGACGGIGATDTTVIDRFVAGLSSVPHTSQLDSPPVEVGHMLGSMHPVTKAIVRDSTAAVCWV